ncbi:MAG TPA: sigma-54 dependent transcriptional regulator [Syntrophales bacterium]|mgnify:CR=1 FL=1|nr:sigma-54 dependent transcriptional regulator [Syntrophales bacterium]HQB29215.1 sigma-54 dependent transcriptional regulator [Syntrophales bacterium]HQN77460.1 sigma-54 dependent transcriptional regulator [Syntrophales bacterium]HQQ27650.1 sigma-54 dependent transcriptional regulator [Syntrophales bacterium]
MNKKILIADDEINMLLVLEAMLRKEGFTVLKAAGGLEALDILEKEDVAVVVTDLRMPGLDGLGLLGRVTEEYPRIPVIIITAHGTVNTAVEALKKGAFDYITKPFDREDLLNVIHKAHRIRAISEAEVVPEAGDIDHLNIIGSSGEMARIFEVISRVAPTTTTVLITGETGTGKELIAHAIHRNSPRRDEPFIKINCAAIAETLLESELFGYEKGAFTGAVHRKPGRFELAHQGTLFLDEVGDLPKDMQVKLLRVVQDQEFERVGGLRTIRVDVRLIAATNRNLSQDVKEGKFREDLFYRLNVVPVHLPPLRERKDDIAPLVDHFIGKFNRKLNRNVRGISPAVREIFVERYDWPGNIRELENLLERLVLFARGELLTEEELPGEIRFYEPRNVPAPSMEEPGTFKEVLRRRTEEIERDMILKVLEECGGNVSRAAQQLGLSRKGLQLKMIRYNLRKSGGSE